MTFLAPMSALLAAAVVLPALLVMYLLKLRRRPLRVSSVMLWPEAATDVQVNVPLAPPRPSWLLLLHLLIASLLIMAAGRPALTGIAGSSGKLLILIDRSASMSARDGEPASGIPSSRLEEAKRRAKAALGRATNTGATTSVAVVSFAATPQIVREFSTDVGGAIATIDEITPTDQPGDIAAALEVSRAMLAGAGSNEDEAGAEVLLFSDGSFEDDGKELILPGVSLRLLRMGPVPAAPKQNLGIVVLSARRDENQLETVRIFVRIQNASPDLRVVPVRLSVDARTIETRSVTVPGLNELGPGEAGETFLLSAPSGGLAMVSLGVDASMDMLASDDAAATYLRSAAPVRALIVGRGTLVRRADQVDDNLSASFLLSDVLEELRLGELKRVTRDQYEEIVRAGGLKFYDVVIFDGVVPVAAPPLPSISFGAGLPVAGLRLSAAPAEGESNAARPFAGWNRLHPLLRDITLDPVVVAKELVRQESNASESAGVGGGVGGVEILARGERSPLILAKQTEGEPRRIVVAFDLVNSNWPLQAGFPIFVKSAIDFLTAKGAESAGTQFTTTQPVSVDVRGEPPTFVGPVRVQSRATGISALSPTGERRVTLGVVDRAGVYTAEASDGATPVAVNLLSAFESEIATSDVLRVGTRTLGVGVGGIVPREIWMWVLLVAAALLSVEWLVFARSARL